MRPGGQRRPQGPPPVCGVSHLRHRAFLLNVWGWGPRGRKGSPTWRLPPHDPRIPPAQPPSPWAGARLTRPAVRLLVRPFAGQGLTAPQPHEASQHSPPPWRPAGCLVGNTPASRALLGLSAGQGLTGQCLKKPKAEFSPLGAPPPHPCSPRTAVSVLDGHQRMGSRGLRSNPALWSRAGRVTASPCWALSCVPGAWGGRQ